MDVLAQVETEIQSENIYELSVIQVFPDSFPTVEVVFQARNQIGQPLWGITVDDLSVFENDNPCEVLEVTNISEKDIIDIALVFDHSGSMGFPVISESLYWTLTIEEYDSLMLLPKPIDFAKEGVLSFAKSAELASDSILIVGFSSGVDEIVGPTQNSGLLESKVSAMQADSGTAFYDALIKTIDHLSLKNNQKTAIVALTDGLDNESRYNLNDVIKKSNDALIPIYVIGLGNVQDSTLQVIADRTDGLYYKTDDPQRLEQIYLNISRQLKSVYKLKYKSDIDGFAEDEQALRFGFLNDTLTFSNPEVRMTLPEEVIQYLHEAESREILILGGTGAGILLLGLTSFALYRRKKKKQFRIVTLYPNPFSDKITIDIESSSLLNSVNLEIVNLNGNVVKNEQVTLNGKSVETSTTALPAGIYMVRLTSPEGLSDTSKAIKN